MNIEVKNSTKLVDYKESMKFLDKRVNDVLLGNKNELLWIIEHKSVYTEGKSAKSEELLNKKIKVIKTSRGGKYTFHGPGQKVVYFVLDLNKRGKDIRKLVRNIENLTLSCPNFVHINRNIWFVVLQIKWNMIKMVTVAERVCMKHQILYYSAKGNEMPGSL